MFHFCHMDEFKLMWSLLLSINFVFATHNNDRNYFSKIMKILCIFLNVNSFFITAPFVENPSF